MNINGDSFMNRITSSVVLVLFAFSITSCGGGSGRDPTFDGGVWHGNVLLTANPCNLTGQPTTFAFTHTVNQNKNAVLLTTDQNVDYVGNTLSDQGFSVDNTGAQAQPIGSGVLCNYSSRINYDGIFDSSDTDSDVTITFTRDCDNAVTCVVTYEGKSTRTL
jgi:hypothetical protein